MLVPFIILTIVAYRPAQNAPYIYDDFSAIVENPSIRTLWPLGESLSAPTQTPLAGRPVANFSFAITRILEGESAPDQRLFNLGIHLACGVLVFSLIRRIMSEGASGVVATWRGSCVAAVIAGLWMVHPLISETVIYVVQRTELLFAFFLLATLYCAMRGFDSSHGRLWSVVAVTCCALGMASKEVMAVGPLLVLLFDRTFLSGAFGTALKRRPGLYAGLAATWAVLIALMSRQPRSDSVGIEHGLSSLDYLSTQAGVIAHYLRLSFVPYPLSIAYDDWRIATSPGDVLLPGLLVIALLAATVWLLIRKPVLGFCGAWFFLILAPTSSFVPIVPEVAAERRMYLPLLAPITLVAAGLGRWAIRRSSVTARRILGGAGIGATLLAAWATHVRAGDYATEESIWRATVQVRPASRAARMNLGNVLLQEGRSDEAIEQYRIAVEADDDDSQAHYNLANALVAAGRNNEAIASFQEAIRVDPKNANAHHNCGIALCNLGRTDEGIAQYREALTLDPNLAAAYCNLGVALRQSDRLNEARQALEKGVAELPTSAQIQLGLADTLLDLEQYDEAIEHYREALRLAPQRIDTRMHYAIALAMSGKTAEAADQLRELLRRDPSHVNARQMLADLQR